MKKVKIMLSAILVLATVGGIMAFKAKSFAHAYCVRLAANGNGVCETSFIGKTTLVANAGTYYFGAVTSNPPA